MASSLFPISAELSDIRFALSIRQPWLICITDYDKRVENRTWAPWKKVIGQRVALHASAKVERASMEIASNLAGAPMSSLLFRMYPGHIGATAVLTGYFDENLALYGDAPDGYDPIADKWAFGSYFWMFADVRKLAQPVKARGSLGFWEPPAQLMQACYATVS